MIEQELLFLGLLKEGARHGYEIRKKIKEILFLFAGLDIKSIYYPLRVLEKKGLLAKKIVKQANKNNKFVISDFNFKDIDRMQTFFNIAVENDRKFLITLKGACFLKWISKDEKFKNIRCLR